MCICMYMFIYNITINMENCKSDTSTSQSNSEVYFLQQVKECQDQLQCMEKLFFELKKKIESENQKKKSQILLSDVDHLEYKNKLNISSLPDLNLFLQNYESREKLKNTVLTKNSKSKSDNEVLMNTNPDLNSVNSNDVLSPLTFVIQIPSNIFKYFKKHNSHLNNISESDIKQLFKSSRKTQALSLLQRLFKKKKKILSTNDVKISQTEILQFLKDNKNSYINLIPSLNKNNSEYISTKININSETNIIDKDLINKEIDTDLNNKKQKKTLTFPIIYKVDEKTCKMVKSNITIHHEIIPHVNSNSWSHCIRIIYEIPNISLDSFHTIEKEDDSIKIINNISTQSADTSNSIKRKDECTEKKFFMSQQQDFQSSEIELEKLIKTLFQTSEKLNNLDKFKVLLENLNKKELKFKKFKNDNKTFKIKYRKSKALNLLLEHVMTNRENNTNYSKSIQKNIQIPKKQLSKTSVCSSLTSLSSSEGCCISPIIIKSKHIQKDKRCECSSMFNYLVCQSEKDNNI